MAPRQKNSGRKEGCSSEQRRLKRKKNENTGEEGLLLQPVGMVSVMRLTVKDYRKDEGRNDYDLLRKQGRDQISRTSKRQKRHSEGDIRHS